jgi:hypothetical protein
MARPFALKTSTANLFSLLQATFSNNSCIAAITKTFDHIMAILLADGFDH